MLKFDKNIYIPQSYIEQNVVNILQKEDVLFNNTNSQEWVGKTGYFEEDGIFLHSNHITVIRVNKEIILPKYLWIALNVYQEKKIFFNICTNWNNQSGVGIDRLLSLKIPVPPLQTQQTIIHIFESAYAEKKAKEVEAKALLESIDGYLLEELGITLPEKQANTLKNRVFLRNISEVSGGRLDGYYYQNEFIELEKILDNLGNSIKFKNLIEIITKGETPLWKGESYVEQGIPFLRVQNISIEGIKNDLIYITKELHNEMKRSKLYGGEILFTMAGSIGIATIYPKNMGEANINQAIAKIILKTNSYVNENFVVEILNSTICKKQSEKLLTVAAQPNINFEQIKSIKIPLPPLEIQEKIVAEITARREQAKRLQTEAKEVLEKAKTEVERMILGRGEND